MNREMRREDQSSVMMFRKILDEEKRNALRVTVKRSEYF
jgi:hypothetical protein